LCVDSQCKECDDGNATDWDGCNNGIIVEFRVNSFTTSNQGEDWRGPAVAVLPNGRFVVVWTSLDQDGDGYGAYGQFYDTDGSPVGSEFAVHEDPAGDQLYPVVAASDEGGFVIAWAVRQGGSTGNILMRGFNASGAPVSPDVQVNSGTIPYPQAVGIVPLEEGRQLVCWSSGGAGSLDVFAQVIKPDGLKEGDAFSVAPYSPGGNRYADASARGGGGFAAAWSGEKGGSGQDIYARFFDDDASELVSEFKVNTFDYDLQHYPAIAPRPAGQFIVVWSGKGGTGSKGIWARLIDADGTAPADQFSVVNSNDPALQYNNPEVASGPDGTFVVVWQSCPSLPSDGQDGQGCGVFGQRFDASANPDGEQMQVNVYFSYDQRDATVATFVDGGFIIVWTSGGQDGSFYGIFAQRFDKDGNRIYH